MRRLTTLCLTAVAVAACADPSARPTAPEEYTVALKVSGGNTSTHLTGDEEVPARETPAQGQATLQISADETEISYKLNVANIDNVRQSHIHVGASGTNGPVVVFLFGPAPAGGGAQNGRLSEGTFTAANLVGPLTGQPLSALIAQIRAGNTYVNVHTDDGVAPANSGPGDFPGGEVRGQIVKGSFFKP